MHRVTWYPAQTTQNNWAPGNESKNRPRKIQPGAVSFLPGPDGHSTSGTHVGCAAAHKSFLDFPPGAGAGVWGAGSPGTQQLVSPEETQAHSSIPCSPRLPPLIPERIGRLPAQWHHLQLQILLLHLTASRPGGTWPSSPSTGDIFPSQGATGTGSQG